MSINILCYDKDDNLIMASMNADIEVGDLVSVYDEDYQVTEAGSKFRGFMEETRVVDLVKFKENKENLR